MKELENDDPMELQAVQLDGDPGYMIDCIVEEYARMGWTAAEIFPLFQSPRYPVLYGLFRTLGAEAIRRRLDEVTTRCGVFRARTFEAPETPELVTIAPLTEGDACDESGS